VTVILSSHVTVSNRSCLNIRIPIDLELRQVPISKDATSIIIGQEFLDCMPVRHFVKTEKGWCEKLVDEAPADSPKHFRFVLSKGPTPAAKICLRKELIPDLPDKPKDWEGIEVSPEAWWAAQEIAKRVHATQGAALFIDYGNDGHATDTLQALKDHKAVDVLSRPGQCDLTAHVDFSSVKRASLDWCPHLAAVVPMEAGGSAASVMPSADELKAMMASLQELEVLYAKLKSQGKDMSMERELLHKLEQVKKKLRNSAPPLTSDSSAPTKAASAKASAAANALFAHGPVSQCDFLHGLGVRERAQALFDAAKDDAAKESIMKQYERLTSPAEMGSLFKVLAITSNKIPTGTMPGFAMPGARDTRS